MTKNNNVIQLLKGISLSGMLFLLGACQSVTAQTAVEGIIKPVHSSSEVKLPTPEVESDVSLRFEDERKAEEIPAPEKTVTEEKVSEPVAPVSKPETTSMPETAKKEEAVPEEPKPTEPVVEEPIVDEPADTEPAEVPPPVNDVPAETKPVEKTKEAEKIEPVYTYEPSYETIVVPYETLYVLNDDMDNDQFQILQEGKDGEMVHTWLHTYKDGVWESKHVTKTAVHDPVPKVMMVGTNIVYVPKNSTYEKEKARIESLPLLPGAY